MSRLTFPGCASGPKVLCTNAIDIPLSWGSRSSARRSQAIRPPSLRANDQGLWVTGSPQAICPPAPPCPNERPDAFAPTPTCRSDFN